LFENLSETDLAYLAGFIDGEGSIHISIQHEEWFQPIISVSNSHKETMGWISSVLGAKCVYQYDKRPESGNWKSMYLASITGQRKILRLLQLIHPYLKTKKVQAKLMMAFCELRLEERMCNPKSGYTQDDIEIYERLCALNKRGNPKIAETVTAGFGKEKEYKVIRA